MVKDKEIGFIPISGYTILTPSGKCPVPWNGDLQDWVQRLQDHVGQEGNTYGTSALKYWLRRLVSATEYESLVADLDK